MVEVVYLRPAVASCGIRKDFRHFGAGYRSKPMRMAREAIAGQGQEGRPGLRPKQKR